MMLGGTLSKPATTATYYASPQHAHYGLSGRTKAVVSLLILVSTTTPICDSNRLGDCIAC